MTISSGGSCSCINNEIRNLSNDIEYYADRMGREPPSEQIEEWLCKSENWILRLSEGRIQDKPLLDKESLNFIIRQVSLTQEQKNILLHETLSKPLLCSYLSLRRKCSYYDARGMCLSRVMSCYPSGTQILKALLSTYFTQAHDTIPPLVKRVTTQIGEELLASVWKTRLQSSYAGKLDQQALFYVDISLPLSMLLEKFKKSPPLIYPKMPLSGKEDVVLCYEYISNIRFKALYLAQALGGGYIYRQCREKTDSLAVYYFFNLGLGEKIEDSSVWSLYDYRYPKERLQGKEILPHPFDSSKFTAHQSSQEIILRMKRLKKKTNRQTLIALREKSREILTKDPDFQKAVSVMRAMEATIQKIARHFGITLYGSEMFQRVYAFNTDPVFPFINTKSSPSFLPRDPEEDFIQESRLDIEEMDFLIQEGGLSPEKAGLVRHGREVPDIRELEKVCAAYLRERNKRLGPLIQEVVELIGGECLASLSTKQGNRGERSRFFIDLSLKSSDFDKPPPHLKMQLKDKEIFIPYYIHNGDKIFHLAQALNLGEVDLQGEYNLTTEILSVQFFFKMSERRSLIRRYALKIKESELSQKQTSEGEIVSHITFEEDRVQLSTIIRGQCEAKWKALVERGEEMLRGNPDFRAEEEILKKRGASLQKILSLYRFNVTRGESLLGDPAGFNGQNLPVKIPGLISLEGMS